MIYRIQKPSAPLSPFIEFFFYYEGYHATHLMDKLLPDGSMDLLIDLTDTPKKLFNDETGQSYSTLKKSWISGMKTEFILIDSSVTHIMGVHFRPGGAYPFMKGPVDELNNLTIELDTIWGHDATTLREAILDEPMIEKKFHLLETFLLQKGKNRLDSHALVQYSVRELSHAPQMWTIRQLSNRTGVTQKHLINLFKKYVGLTPKMFSRVNKFQKVIQLIQEGQKIDWAMLAYECGYFDQAHFIKEFRSFSGINPVSYLEKRGPFLNYLPIA